ncbi:MAG: hypothetical protein CME62_14040 [Halobacteriovoraceae bacterium]|nr:hypothetical protein [Halobacteriovoraceae bacterium]
MFGLLTKPTLSAEFSLGEWDINYPQSYLVLRNIELKENQPEIYPQYSVETSEVILDFLFFESMKDIFKYSIRVEGLNITYTSKDDAVEDDKKDEPSKIQLDKINLPFSNIVDELYFPSINIELIRKQENRENKIKMSLEELLFKEIKLFPKQEQTNDYANFTTKGELLEGSLEAKGKGHPLMMPPLLDLDLKLKGISLTKITDYLPKDRIDFESGTMDISLFFVTKSQKVEGQIYLNSENAEFIEGWNSKKPFTTALKESFLDMGLEIVDRTDQDVIEGIVRFSGNKNNIDWDYWVLFESLLDHIFGGEVIPETESYNLPTEL